MIVVKALWGIFAVVTVAILVVSLAGRYNDRKRSRGSR